jgi:hypothetical protein
MLAYRDLTNRIIGLAIEVHRTIGPGLLEPSMRHACAMSLNKPASRSSGRSGCL